MSEVHNLSSVIEEPIFVTQPCYDTIGLRLNRECNVEEIKSVISNTNARLKEETGEILFFYGKLQNLTVKVDSRGVSISGSFPKFFHGNNLDVISLGEVRDVLAHLSDTLHLPISDARVFRLDIGANIFPAKPVREYLALFGKCGRVERTARHNGRQLTYETAGHVRTLSFYDKLSEMAHSKQVVPDGLPSPYCLRYEVQFFKRLQKQFGVAQVSASLLTQPEFYFARVKQWRDLYFNIDKVRELRLSSVVRNGKDFAQTLAATKLRELSELELFAMLEAGKADRTKRNNQLIRNKMKQLASAESITADSELIRELDAKITEACNIAEKGLE